jgi:hypothetical protein
MSISKKYKMSGLIGEVLTILEPRVTKLMNDYQVEYESKWKKSPSKFDLECTEMYLVFDIIKSFGSYTKSDDKIVEIKSSTSIKGNLEINGVIKRDNVDYIFRTEAIYAGGYNVQRLHYRYLTKTKLPQSVSPLVKEFNERIKKMNKVQRLEEDLKRVETLVRKYSEGIEKYSKFSDEQILEECKKRSTFYVFPSWEEIVKRGADKNYEYSEEKYNSYVENSRLEDIERFKKSNIEFPKGTIIRLEKDIKRIKTRIEEAK